MDAQTAAVAISTDLIPAPETRNEVASLNRIADQAQEFVQHSKAANTVRAYERDWQDFQPLV